MRATGPTRRDRTRLHCREVRRRGSDLAEPDERHVQLARPAKGSHLEPSTEAVAGSACSNARLVSPSRKHVQAALVGTGELWRELVSWLLSWRDFGTWPYGV